MAIIVTGASGQFGLAAALRLLRKVPPQEMILTTRKPQQLAELAARGAQVRRADFDDPASLEEAFAGGDRMLLISTARTGARVGQHRNAIEAARRAGVRHIVYTSILGAAAEGNPALVKLDHRATEEILEASGLAWTFLRDSQYAEVLATTIAPAVLRTGRQYSCAGNGRVAFVSRSDCVDCAVSVITTSGHENRAYDLTGPQAFSYPEAAALISVISGRPIEFIRVDDDGLFAVFDAMGIPRQASDEGGAAGCSTDRVSFERSIREGYFNLVTDHVRKLSGHPPTSLRQVLLEESLEWP